MTWISEVPNQAQFLYTFLMKKSYTIGCVNLMNLIWRCRVFHHACDDTIQLGSHIQANTCVTLFPSHWDLSSPLVNCQKLNISHCCCIWPVPMANGWFRSIVRHVEFEVFHQHTQHQQVAFVLHPCVVFLGPCSIKHQNTADPPLSCEGPSTFRAQ